MVGVPFRQRRQRPDIRMKNVSFCEKLCSHLLKNDFHFSLFWSPKKWTFRKEDPFLLKKRLFGGIKMAIKFKFRPQWNSEKDLSMAGISESSSNCSTILWRGGPRHPDFSANRPNQSHSRLAAFRRQSINRKLHFYVSHASCFPYYGNQKVRCLLPQISTTFYSARDGLLKHCS